MTIRQKMLRFLYPAILRITGLLRKKTSAVTNDEGIPPTKSLYDLSIELNNGSTLSLNSMKGKKLL
ncbi:MAG TPA: hypothetical protein VM012_11815, partial [Flavitalea sp.]|nr:hypothetical protein [Flavitalea sp.]